MAEDSEKVPFTSVIPELYYDLIARIIPGLVVVLWLSKAYASAWALSYVAQLDWAPATILFVLYLSGAYVAGMLLTPGGHALSGLYRFNILRSAMVDRPDLATYLARKYHLDFIPEEMDKEKVKGLSRAQLDHFYQVMHDVLKDSDRMAKLILPKQQAQTVMCANFSAGLVVILLLTIVSQLANGLPFTQLFTEQAEYLAFTEIGLVTAIIAARYHSRRLVKRHLSFLAKMRGEKTGTPSEVGSASAAPICD